MIRIRRGAVERPGSLVDASGAGALETGAAKAHFWARATRGAPFEFVAYKQPDVKAALQELFGEKCAYCEGTFRHTAPVDIEHFRPKGGVKFTEHDKLRTPGYYWLAAEWDNLLPSCIDCNRARSQLIGLEPGDPSEVRGKENHFPVAHPPPPDRQLNHRTWDEAAENEGRLLLHPCRDSPESHLRFLADGRVEGRTPKGEATIRILGLNRRGLRLARRAHALELASRMQTCAVLVRAVARSPRPDVFLEAELERVMLELETKTFDRQPFAALSRELVDGFFHAVAAGAMDRHLEQLFTTITQDPDADPAGILPPTSVGERHD